ncbi:MAG: hypothetical protein P8J87_01130, partial [Verrucomicrobiales bacterium]|nr:hypothetical protein [Verrucomicrobiales bacterium]
MLASELEASGEEVALEEEDAEDAEDVGNDLEEEVGLEENQLEKNEGEEESVAERDWPAEVAVVAEDAADGSALIEAELTPDEIWEMEALGRFPPVDSVDSAEALEGGAADGPVEADAGVAGMGLFPTRSELIDEEEEVALGAGFFSTPGAFDDLDETLDGGEETGGEDEVPAESGDLPWTSLDVGGAGSKPADLAEQKLQFESFFKDLEAPVVEVAEEKTAPVRPIDSSGNGEPSGVTIRVGANERLLRSNEGENLPATPVVEFGWAKSERQETETEREGGSRMWGRRLVFAVVVAIGMAGAGTVVVSQDLARPLTRWASAFFGGVERGENDTGRGGEATELESAAEVLPVVPPVPIGPEVVKSVEPELVDSGGVLDQAPEEIGILPALLGDGSEQSMEESGVGGDLETGLVVAEDAERGAENEGDETIPEAVDPIDAKSVLMGFLRADTVEQLLETVHQDGKLVEEIRSYYPDGKVPSFKVQDVKLEMSATVPSSERDTHLFVVQLEGEEVGIPVSVENTGGS